ncbi:MAG: hypothetical protein V7L20_10005 [Nostoc sp.]|uniref:hypothetical protein n=1 Tax=Nostoc sp. TaxID=1180 RepID=UPI002FF89CBA
MFTIKNLNCDAVFRKHQSRITTMRKGKIVEDCDKLVTWYKPKTCPKGLNKDEFNALPPSIVPERPARTEPRVTKRRPKPYPRLTKSRQELPKQLQTA